MGPWVRVNSLTNDVDSCRDAICRFQDEKLFWLAGYEWEFSDDYEEFRIRKHGVDLRKYFDEEEIEKDKVLAGKLNL